MQGFDKLVRRVTETKGAKEWAKLAARAVALGIAPSLLNALLYHDDDEWDDLRDSDKDTNYMFKLGNGYWLQIPKGRELSLLGITADRVADAIYSPRSSTRSSSTRTAPAGRGTAETLRASACRTTHPASATTAVRTCSPRPWARRWASRRKS